MDAFKHEIPISGYMEAILGKKQILQDEKNPNHLFTDILQNMLKKIQSTNSSSGSVSICVCYCFSCRSILKP